MDQQQNSLIEINQNTNKHLLHPNGKPISYNLHKNRLRRDDTTFFKDTFPNTEIGQVLKGLIVEFLIKQEHRIGWARKSACDDSELLLHPNETVASHMWGVAKLIMVLSRTKKFKEEMPLQFDVLKAIEMALIHDVAELITGDITPVDSITPEEKHEAERKAMIDILGCFPEQIDKSLSTIYATYEEKQCVESKFVKDCDKLDFIINAFILERQGFTGFEEFYDNTRRSGFNSKLVREMADLLVMKRNELCERNMLFTKN